MASYSTISPYLPARPKLVAFSALSFLTGILEAFMLVLLVQSAIAIADGRSTTNIDVGPLELGRRGLVVMLGVALIAAFLALAMRMVADRLSARFSEQALIEHRSVLFRSFVESSWPVKAVERDGHLQEMYAGHAGSVATLVVWVATGLDAAFSLIALLASALAIQWVVTLFVGVLVVMLYFALKPLVRLSRRIAMDHVAQLTDLSTSVTEAASMSLELTVFDVGKDVADDIDRGSEKVARLFGRTKFLGSAIPDLYRGSTFIFILLGLLAVRLIDGINVAALASVLVILLRGLGYVQTLQRTTVYLNQLTPYADRLTDQVDTYRESAPSAVGPVVGEISTIAMDDVTFSYGDAPALKAVSFSVDRGESIGIVGPSGSGKSTLFQILMRLREPSGGRYLLGDQNAADWSRHEWFSRIALVAQESKLYRGSVADNISFHRNLSIEDVERAARLAHIHDVIVEWPDGYDTDVGEKGGQLSGGQKQRLSLARALAGHPEILFLDEPTSALDMKSEAAIQDALDELAGSVTMFIIAHRVSTLARCDRIMVFDEGEMVAFESPDALSQHSDFYSEVLELAVGGDSERISAVSKKAPSDEQVRDEQ